MAADPLADILLVVLGNADRGGEARWRRRGAVQQQQKAAKKRVVAAAAAPSCPCRCLLFFFCVRRDARLNARGEAWRGRVE